MPDMIFRTREFFRRGCSLFAGLLLALACPLAAAEPAWVSDQFEVMLRSGPSTNNAIQLMVGSGTELEVLERDPDSGYSRVRTQGGTEGWVLTRYLMSEPAARQQLQALAGQLTNAQASGSSLASQLEAIRGEQQEAERRIAALTQEKAALEQQLADIRRTAADVLAIDEQNRRLQQQLTDAEIRVDTLEQQNQTLSGQRDRNWFIAGASVLFAGMLLGIWLPRIRWRKRSRYDSF